MRREKEAIYSRTLKGDTNNWRGTMTLDIADGGYVGITQSRPDEPKFFQRVLLTPKQVDALIDWLRKRRRAP